MKIHRTGLWRNPEFMKLWVGQTISEFGSCMGSLPLLAVLVIHATPAQMGLLAAFGSFPILAVGLFAGVWVDRLRRRPLLIAADLGRFLALGSIPLAYAFGSLTLLHVFVVAAGVGVLMVLFNVAYPSYFPSLVSREQLIEGNSKLGVSSSVAEIAGTPLGFGVVQKIGAPLGVLADALTFLVSAISLGLIHQPEPPPAPPEERKHIFREIRSGLSLVVRHPLLRALVLTAGMQTFFGFFFAALYTIYGLRVLGLSPALLGIVIGVGGVGSLCGAFLSPRVAGRWGVGGTLIGTVLVSGVVGFLTPLASGPPWRAAAFLMTAQFFGDVSMTVYNITERSLRQSVLPDRLLGRATASMQFLVEGMGPLGALVGGALGEGIGIRGTLLIAVVGHLLSVVWIVFSPVRRLRDVSLPEEAGMGDHHMPEGIT